MEVEGAEHPQHMRANMPPPKQPTPAKVQQTISVATMFNRPKKETMSATKDPQPAVAATKSASKNPANGLARYSKIRASSQTPHKVGKNPRKRSGMHPLATAFKSTSDNYRRSVYKSATLKINSTLEKLLSDLQGQSVQPASSDANEGSDSPIRLSLPAKFERQANKIYQPISPYKIGLTHTDTDGKRTNILVTLEDRMTDYVDHIEEEKAKIAELKDQWEATVGEIWKIGVQCLGERAMEAMLFADKSADELQTVSARGQSTLFVPEQGTSPPPRSAANKKRVTFDTPDDENGSAQSKIQELHFLYQPSRLRQPPVPAMPALPKEELSALEMQIEELGLQQLDDLKQAEKDYKLFWQKKNRMLAQVFVED